MQASLSAAHTLQRTATGGPGRPGYHHISARASGSIYQLYVQLTADVTAHYLRCCLRGFLFSVKLCMLANPQFAPLPQAGCRGRSARVRVAAVASTQRATTPSSLPVLIEQIVTLARESGPRGPQRFADGVRATLEVAAEVLTPGAALPTPSALLRRLFERLGATYIKLGQFIASSPTLFPPEYVAGALR